MTHPGRGSGERERQGEANRFIASFRNGSGRDGRDGLRLVRS